jgi:cell division protein FtsL
LHPNAREHNDGNVITGRSLEMQKLKVSLDRYETEWGQLQLELMTLSEHSRIEDAAYSRLHFITPKYNDIIYIKQ